MRIMSPIVRGRAVPQIESSGRTKRSLDILLWAESLSRQSFRMIDELQQLREYLASIDYQGIRINLWLPDNFANIHSLLKAYAITSTRVTVAVPHSNAKELFGTQAPTGMKEAAATALSCDADLVVTENPDWFPFCEEFQELGVLLGSSHTMLPQSEIFVRGHDIPWAFNSPLFDAPWSTFYFLAENNSLVSGQSFLDACQRKGIDKQVQEIGRTLVYNRIPNILFTRDRLLFYEMQQAAAKRARWKRQKFQLEVGYYLNFYYILLYGAFDHLAVLLNGVLGLGLVTRNVTATGQLFLKALQRKAPELHAIFTEQRHLISLKELAH